MTLERWYEHGAFQGSVERCYDAQFPSEAYKAGARRFPMIVPMSPDDPAIPMCIEARERLREFRKPFLTCFAPADPLLGAMDKYWQNAVPGAHGVRHATIANAGHFLQEDQGEELAQILNDFVAATPS